MNKTIDFAIDFTLKTLLIAAWLAFNGWGGTSLLIASGVVIALSLGRYVHQFLQSIVGSSQTGNTPETNVNWIHHLKLQTMVGLTLVTAATLGWIPLSVIQYLILARFLAILVGYFNLPTGYPYPYKWGLSALGWYSTSTPSLLMCDIGIIMAITHFFPWLNVVSLAYVASSTIIVDRMQATIRDHWLLKNVKVNESRRGREDSPTSLYPTNTNPNLLTPNNPNHNHNHNPELNPIN